MVLPTMEGLCAFNPNYGQSKQRSHRSSNRFGIVEIDGGLNNQHTVGSKRVCGTNNCPQISPDSVGFPTQ